MIYIPMPAFWEHLVLQPLPYYCNDTSQESPFYLTVTSPALPSCCLPPSCLLPCPSTTAPHCGRISYCLLGDACPPSPAGPCINALQLQLQFAIGTKPTPPSASLSFQKYFHQGQFQGKCVSQPNVGTFKNISYYSAIMRKKTYLSVLTWPRS